jgi:hypothetical protein
MSLPRYLAPAATAAMLSGCGTTPSMPQDYDGPIATITDSAVRGSTDGLDFFFLQKINGNEIENSLADTAQANSGMGLSMRPVVIERRVPTEPATFTIVGRTHYAAPILELTNTVYEVSGNVKFAPLPNHVYMVQGSLRKNHSAVWIEDESTGEVMGRKIEKDGSAALGFFSK